MTLTALVASMAVNTLVTGLIVFKILRVFWEVKATSIERTVGSLGSTGDTKLQHIIFIIIESGMALLAIQLVRVVISSPGLEALQGVNNIAHNIIVCIHQMLNVIIIRSVHFYFCFTDEIYLARASHQQ